MNIERFYQQTVKLGCIFVLLSLLALNSVSIPNAKAQGEITESPSEVPTVESSATPAITETPFSTPVLEDGNVPAVLTTTPHCGAISGNQTWSSADNVHVVTSCNGVAGVIVASGATLTIEAGAIVKFNLGTELNVNGTLLVLM